MTVNNTFGSLKKLVESMAESGYNDDDPVVFDILTWEDVLSRHGDDITVEEAYQIIGEMENPGIHEEIRALNKVTGTSYIVWQDEPDGIVQWG